MKRMGLIVHPGEQSPQRVFDEYRAAAKALGIETIVFEVQPPSMVPWRTQVPNTSTPSRQRPIR
jgi:hypothetical protein